MTEYLVMIEGTRFDYLLCSVYAATRVEAVRLAKREVEAGDKWHLTQRAN